MNENYSITSDDLDFLMTMVAHPLVQQLLSSAQKHASAQNKRTVIIQLTKNQAQQIVDDLAHAFSAIGIDSNSEPNSIGLRIESIIDTFATP